MPMVEPCGELRVGRCEHCRGEKRGIDRAGLADGERSDRDPGGHLDDRQQAIHALQRLAFDGNSENRERGHRSGHAGKMGCAAGAGDDRLQSPFPGRMCVFVKPLRRTVSGHDLRLVCDSELFERLGSVAHRLPIGAAAHNYADERLRHRPALKQWKNAGSFRDGFRPRQRRWERFGVPFVGDSLKLRIFKSLESRYDVGERQGQGPGGDV